MPKQTIKYCIVFADFLEQAPNEPRIVEIDGDGGDAIDSIRNLPRGPLWYAISVEKIP